MLIQGRLRVTVLFNTLVKTYSSTWKRAETKQGLPLSGQEHYCHICKHTEI